MLGINHHMRSKLIQTIILIVGLLGIALSCASPFAAALSQDQLDTYQSGVRYFDVEDSSSCTNSGGSTVVVPPGTLPSFIPEPYNGAFTEAANKYNVAPQLLASLFSEEHNLGSSETAPKTSSLPRAWASFVKSHPNPNSGWGTSSTGAAGPFQFEPGTWASYGVDGDNDGQKNVQDLVDASFGAANYAAQNHATADTGPGNGAWDSFVERYGAAQWYLVAVTTYYKYYSGAGTAPAGGSSTTVTVDSSCGTTASCNTDQSTASTGSGIGQTVVCVAQNELSLWQSQSNYNAPYPGFTYARDGFLKYSDGSYEEWCADFVSWVYKQAGHAFTGGASGGWRIAGVIGIGGASSSLAEQAQGFTWHPAGSGYTPSPGDIAIHGTSHTNIFISYNNGRATYIGGDQAGNNEPSGTYGTKNPPSGSIVSTETGNGYFDLGITGYVSPN